MSLYKYAQMILIVFFITNATASLSDSLLIEGHYSQQGISIRRGELEAFLLGKNIEPPLVKRSKACRLTARAIGVTMWCVNLGIAVYQVNQFIDAVENQQPMSTK